MNDAVENKPAYIRVLSRGYTAYREWVDSQNRYEAAAPSRHRHESYNSAAFGPGPRTPSVSVAATVSSARIHSSRSSRSARSLGVLAKIASFRVVWQPRIAEGGRDASPVRRSRERCHVPDSGWPAAYDCAHARTFQHSEIYLRKSAGTGTALPQSNSCRQSGAGRCSAWRTCSRALVGSSPSSIIISVKVSSIDWPSSRRDIARRHASCSRGSSNRKSRRNTAFRTFPGLVFIVGPHAVVEAPTNIHQNPPRYPSRGRMMAIARVVQCGENPPPNAQHYRAEARRIRRDAKRITDGALCRQLLDIAAQYDRLADNEERRPS
jgi:hypothetical protein